MAKAARATISDVAKAAKTGKTSISRYLNGEKHLLSDDLLSRIEKAIAELDYRPSLMARGLKHGRARSGAALPGPAAQLPGGRHRGQRSRYAGGWPEPPAAVGPADGAD